MTLQTNLWSAQLPNGEVRAGTLEQLGEAFRAGLIGETTLVCAAGSDQWARLADILAAAGATAPANLAPPVGGSVAPRPSAMPRPSSVPSPVARPSSVPAPAMATGELWQVRLAGGDIRSGTRQQLEEAIAAGHLGADLLALPGGATSWRPLGAILAGSVPPPSPPPSASVAPVPVAPSPSRVPAAAAPSRPPQAGDETLQVRLPDGQIRAGTRAQLEEAFRGGHLDASTLVLAAGAAEWTPLHVAIVPPAPAQAVAPQAEPAPQAVAAQAELAPQAVVPQAEDAPQAVAPQAVVAPADTETSLAPDTQDSLPAASPGDETPVTSSQDTPVAKADGSPEPQWQVQLSERQLDAVFAAGLLGDDALVMAIGTDQWIRLGDARRSRLG
jgi:hypothetical protein